MGWEIGYGNEDELPRNWGFRSVPCVQHGYELFGQWKRRQGLTSRRTNISLFPILWDRILKFGQRTVLTKGRCSSFVSYSPYFQAHSQIQKYTLEGVGSVVGGFTLPLWCLSSTWKSVPEISSHLLLQSSGELFILLLLLLHLRQLSCQWIEAVWWKKHSFFISHLHI